MGVQADTMPKGRHPGASEALCKLKEGNRLYLEASRGIGDTSLRIRQETCANGQHPYAVIVTCSDSRVIPESIFMAGIGDLFVIRVAGNVIDDSQLGSIEYAVDHLGCQLIVVMGHTHCGAVDAAIHHEPDGYVRCLTDAIKAAIGGEQDDERACRLNVAYSVRKIENSLKGRSREAQDLQVAGALYRTEDGSVEFF